MLKFYKKTDRMVCLFTVFLLVAIALLAYLFPYSGDDWAWGSETGMERLMNRFADYNGRYAGNLLVMALTRCKPLAVLVVSVLLVAVCLLPKIFVGGKGVIPCAAGAFMLLTLPKGVFTQAVVWTSGFSNYVPPVVLTMLYFVTVRNIFKKETPEYKLYMGPVCAVLGFVGALFMENITVFNVAISIVIIADAFRRYRRFFAPHMLYFAGSSAGAVLMFSNSAYGLIANKEDFYRSTLIERGIFYTLTENFRHLFDNLLSDNIIGVMILSVLCGALCFSLKKDSAKSFAVCHRAFLCNLVSLVVIFSKGRLDDWEVLFESTGYAFISTAILFAVAAVYAVSVGIILYLGVKDDVIKNKVMFLYVCIPLSAAPLMVVNPVGPRCFFLHCFLLSGICVAVLVYLIRSLELRAEVMKKLGGVVVCGVVLALAFLTGIYAIIHSCDVQRNEYVKKQADAGFKTVVTYYMPFNGYVWNGDPDCVPWNDDYKQFHNIPDKVKFKFILRESFEEFIGNFEQ